MATTVAVLGTGTMGLGMAHSLLRAGLAVNAWNRSPDKARPLLADGARTASSPAEAVRDADVVITMLFDAESVEQVITDAADAMADRAVWLQTSTIGPDGTARLADLARRRGLALVDAPVLGTKPQAEGGELVMLVAGAAAAVEAAQPVLDAIGSRTVRLGDEPGAASALKLVANAYVGVLNAAIAQSVALADALGLDARRFPEVLAGSGSDSPYLQAKSAAMIEGRTGDTQFALDGVRKDLGLVRDVAVAAGVPTTLVDGALEAYRRASDAGHGGEDMAGVVAAFRP